MRWIGMVAAMALWPVAALAQPVFFDDFDGDELLPHWRTPSDPARWEHSVSGGMLHVTDLFWPSTPPANNAVISALFAPQTDFRMDVWMGWENPTEPWNELWFSVGGPVGGIFTQFGMQHLAGEPPEILAAATGAGRVTAPAPPPGIHQFTIARTGSQFDFYLDGERFASLPDMGEVTPVGAVSIFFSKPFPGEMNPYHIDRVRVIPAPSSLLLPMAVAGACIRRRRCSALESAL